MAIQMAAPNQVSGQHSQPNAHPTPKPPWVVLQFGDTCAASVANWRNIAAVVRARLGEGLRPVVVQSALSEVSGGLNALLAGALLGECGAMPEVTELGVAYLRAQGLDVAWIDARTLLGAEGYKGASTKAHVLSAACRCGPDPAMQARLLALGADKVVLTQGSMASDDDGNTVLPGRGGSDPSGAYIAAKLEAVRLEIWTDVPGLYTANPRSTPTARLLRSLSYDEALEIATSDAQVLHPSCILPVRQYGIPLYLYGIKTPEQPGTVISAAPADDVARVKAICLKKGITLVMMDSPTVGQKVGFLSDVLQIFKQHRLSVDQISTSETRVTVSLDPAANTLDSAVIARLVADLSALCRVQVLGPCASLSLVGRNIRDILHKLGEAFELFEGQKLHLISQAANDLHFTLVINEDQGEPLVKKLHELLIRPSSQDRVMGPTWQQLARAQGTAACAPAGPPLWWERKREQLLAIGAEHGCAYVYDGETVDAAMAALRGLQAFQRVLYSIKANPHAGILARMAAAGMSFECVSRGEVDHILKTIPGIERGRILFTPNFAPQGEYAFALAKGVWVTLDNLHPLRHWGPLFSGRKVFVRIDPGFGRGHHEHVKTAGTYSKFGIPLSEMDELVRLSQAHQVEIVGMHAHTGSGIFNIYNWSETAALLGGLSRRFPHLRIIDVGGGIGVPERLGQRAIDLAALDGAMAKVRAALPGYELWLEPGRYLVAQAGVLLAQVTQLKGKGEVQYIGVATGMNSLIRPALYGAYHEIVNLTRFGEPATQLFNIVGPICESGDQLGHDRLLPKSEEGDILLVANAGAYGRAMSSHYNLRDPAIEILI